MNPDLQRPKGTQDILPPESWRYDKMRRIALDIARQYGFNLIETPIFEQTAVFLRVGEATDIVQHERYSFVDAGGVDLTLRPEGTAAVARAYIQNGLYNWPKPLKLVYWGPMFRRERPQAERYRQHTQFGAELYGSEQPTADAEIILLACRVVERVGLENPEVRINSIGCAVCRPRYRQALVEYYADRREELCQDCQNRMEKNPLRLLDCKIDVAIRQTAPDLAEYWCDDCRTHIESVMEQVQGAGRTIRRDPYLVRGLDYYTRTVFEVGHPSLGSATALFGGGRYDGLSGQFDGPSAPAVGFGMGIERMLSAVGNRLQPDPVSLVYIAHLPGFENQAQVLGEQLRNFGLATECDLLNRSLKAQLREAGKTARFTVIIGGQEWEQKMVQIKDFTAGSQQPIAVQDLAGHLLNQLRSLGQHSDGGANL